MGEKSAAIRNCKQATTYHEGIAIDPREVSKIKTIISDLLAELLNYDVRRATYLSRRIARILPWLKEI